MLDTMNGDMDQNFTTTFIPKKPIMEQAPRTSRPAGILTIIAMLIFLATLVIGGGSYLYANYLNGRTEELRKSIGLAEKNFEISTISELQVLDKRLSVASMILKNHRVVTPFFRLLEETTLPAVRFSKFDFSISDAAGAQGAESATALSGEAEGYRAIAQQSGVFGEHTAIRDHIFSNFILTPRGRVSFDLVFNVDPDLLDFETQVAGDSASWLPGESVQSTSSTVQTNVTTQMQNSPLPSPENPTSSGPTGNSGLQNAPIGF